MQCSSDFWRAFHNFTPGLTMTESSSRFNALDNPVEDYNHKQNKNTRAKTGIDFPGDYLRHLIFSNIYLFFQIFIYLLVEGDKML